MFKIFFEDLEVGQVHSYGSITVDKDEVIEFASKYDPQAFHLDEEAAKHSVFGGLCASGWHTISMTMGMMVRHFLSEGVASMGSPGVDNISWKRPVFPGDQLRVELIFTDKRDSKSRPNIGFMAMNTTVFNQNDEVVMTMTGPFMMMKRAAAPTS